METTKYSQCEMCSARCPIEVTLQDGAVSTIFGNPNVGSIGTRLCAKGAAAKWLLHDTEKPARPQIRTGPRGSGQWRDASWDEAYAYVAERLQLIKEKHGPEHSCGLEGAASTTSSPKLSHAAWALPMISPTTAFVPCLCTRPVRPLGVGRKAIGFDIENAEYVVLYGRNIYESLTVAEVNQLMTAMDNGGQDRNGGSEGLKNRGEITLLGEDKAGDRLGFQSALMNEIIKNRLYDDTFVNTGEGFRCL